MILSELTALAETIAAATGLPCTPGPGDVTVQARAVALYPPVLDWDKDTIPGRVDLAHWTLACQVRAAGTSPVALRQLVDDAEAVLAAVPLPWRVTHVTPAVDTSGLVPLITLTLERA